MPISRVRRLRHARTESGASALELAFLAPGLIFLIFLVIQAGLFFYGKTVAIQAAREGVSQLRLAQTRRRLPRHPGRRRPQHRAAMRCRWAGRHCCSRGPCPTYDEQSGRVTMEVQGDVITLVPGLTLRATAHAEGAVERFEPDENAP